MHGSDYGRVVPVVHEYDVICAATPSGRVSRYQDQQGSPPARSRTIPTCQRHPELNDPPVEHRRPARGGR